MRTPEESTRGNFFRKKATFCEDERLVGQIIIGRPRDIWDLKKESLQWPWDLYCGGRGYEVLGRVRPVAHLAA